MPGLKILFAEDDTLTRILVTEILASAGHSVDSVASVGGALALSATTDYHVVISDLHFGSGPTGVDLLVEILDAQPWIGAVVLTSQASPQLIARNADELPDSVVYLIKSRLRDARSLLTAVDQAIQRSRISDDAARPDHSQNSDLISVTRTQADLLSMLGQGHSLSRIARTRGTSVRAVEMLAWRLYERLGVAHSDDVDPRTAAVLLWREGRVVTVGSPRPASSRRRWQDAVKPPVLGHVR